MERFSAAQAGPVSTPWSSCFPMITNMDDIKAQLRELGSSLILCNLPPATGQAGTAERRANPERKSMNSDEGLTKGIDAAQALGFDRMNCLVGLKQDGLSDRRDPGNSLMENIRYAAGALGRSRASGLMVEPINHLDMPGFALNTCMPGPPADRGDPAIPTPTFSSTSTTPGARTKMAAAILRDHLRPDRAYPDCRLPGPPPARHRETDFQVPSSGDRSHGLSGVRLAGVHPAPEHPDSLGGFRCTDTSNAQALREARLRMNSPFRSSPGK